MLIVFSTVNLYSLELTKPESVLYDTANKRWLASDVGQQQNMTDGKIFILDNEGKPTDVFIENLADPKGIIVLDGKLYVTDLTKVHIIDLATAEIIKTIDILGATFLNDIVADNNHNIYISDNASNKIFVMTAGTYDITTACTINAPNGMMYLPESNLLLIVSFDNSGKIYEYNIMTGIVKTYAKINNAYMDGIVKDNNNNFYISSWKTNSIIKYNADFTEANEFKTDITGPADIYFSEELNILAIPAMEEGLVYFFQFIGPPTKPIHLAPGEGSSNLPQKFAFSWSKCENVFGYIIHICKNREFPIQEDFQADMSSDIDTVYNHEEPLFDYNSIYYWYVEAIGEAGSAYSDTLAFVTKKDTYIFEQNNKATISIYPIPSNNILNIKMNNNDLINSIKLFSIEGECVYNADAINTTSSMINVNKYPKGIYYILIENSSNNYLNKIIIGN